MVSKIKSKKARELSPEKILTVEGLSKSYALGSSVTPPALAALNFSAKVGEVIGLLGPNGSGKSTTLKILSGVLKEDSGSVTYRGISKNQNLQSYQQLLGFVPEITAVYPELKVKEYLNLMATLLGLDAQTSAERVAAVTELFSLERVSNHLCEQLSKGYTQRVMLAQALLHQPEILILDEPNTGLDPEQIEELHQIILSLKESMIIILSSHQLLEVDNLCERVIGLSRGQQVFDEQLAGREVKDLYQSLKQKEGALNV